MQLHVLSKRVKGVNHRANLNVGPSQVDIILKGLQPKSWVTMVYCSQHLVTASAEECEFKWVFLLHTRFRTQLRRCSTSSSKKVARWTVAASKVATQEGSAIFKLSFNYVAGDGVESIENFHLSNALTALESQSKTCTTFSKPPCDSLSCIGSTAPTSSVLASSSQLYPLASARVYQRQADRHSFSHRLQSSGAA